jgi:Flp pilus assembly protein TadB
MHCFKEEPFMEWLVLGACGFVFVCVFFLLRYFLQGEALLALGGKALLGGMAEKIARIERGAGLGKWMEAYDKKIAGAGLLQADLRGEQIVIAKQVFALGAICFCFLPGVPWIVGVWFVLGGFFLPDIYLRDRIARRRLELVRSLPDLLDLLTLMVEAGLDLGSAIQTVLIKGRRNALGSELELCANEIRLGVSRGQALQNMANRLQIRDISIFVNTVIHAEKMGTGLSTALRVQAGANRERRMQRAEKMALEAPVKMVFPLVFFIFPVVFIVLLGPMIVQWMQK